MDANTLAYEGQPMGFDAGSAVANTVRPIVAGDIFAGWCLRAVDNTTAGAANPNFMFFGQTGTGLVGGALCRLAVSGRIRLNAARVPNAAGTLGAITGFAGTQADVGKSLYWGSANLGFTNTASGGSFIGNCEAVGLTNAGNTYWDFRFGNQLTQLVANASLGGT